MVDAANAASNRLVAFRRQKVTGQQHVSDQLERCRQLGCQPTCEMLRLSRVGGRDEGFVRFRAS